MVATYRGTQSMFQWHEFARCTINKKYFLLILFTSLMLQGCNMPVPASDSSLESYNYTITPMLREFYADLNGERYLGPAISLDFEFDGSTCQYTTNALLCMNPVETDPARRFYLAPLGSKLGVAEPPDDTVETSSPFIIDGYRIYPAFMVVYNDLRGKSQVGPPLSNVIYNQESNCIEQHFQNAGFYIRLDDPDARVELLPYGRYTCKTCNGDRQQQPTLAVPNTATEPAMVFRNGIDRLGGTQIFGKPISQTFTAPDGNIEQVYETVAVYVTQDQPEIIRFRPLPIALGMHSESPRYQQYDRQDNMIFYQTEGEMGYHVPVIFDEFILMHGGTTYSGQPISDPFDIPEQKEVWGRQCFANYCLDYLLGVPEGQEVRITPLGKIYLEQINPSLQPAGQIAVSQPLQLLVSELLPQPGSTDNQVLRVAVFQQSNSQPVAGITVVATLTTPTGIQQTYQSPPTDESGTTTISISPLPGTKHGDMITYQICLAANAGQPVCQFESYLIWDLN